MTSPALSLRLTAYAVCAFVALPIIIVVVSSLTAAGYVTFPPQGVSFKWYDAVFRDVRLLNAVRVSLTVAVPTAVLAVAAGLGAAFVLDRYPFRGSGVLSAVIMAPLVLPTIVLALGMVFFMTAVGLISSVPGLVAGHLVVAMPFAVRSLMAAMEGLDRDVERSAAILGATRAVILYKVTLPLLKPGLIAAFIFSFLSSFDNVSISLFVAGPTTQTLPLEIFRMAQDVSTPKLSAIATLVMGFTLALVLALEKRFKLYGVLERQHAR